MSGGVGVVGSQVVGSGGGRGGGGHGVGIMWIRGLGVRRVRVVECRCGGGQGVAEWLSRCGRV